MQGKYFIVSSKYGYDIFKGINKFTVKIKVERDGWLLDFDVIEEFGTKFEAENFIKNQFKMDIENCREANSKDPVFLRICSELRACKNDTERDILLSWYFKNEAQAFINKRKEEQE